MPAQTFRLVRLLTDIQQTLHISDACNRLNLVLLVRGCDLIKEGGRRKLTGITHNHKLTSTHECSQCILRSDLTCLIKDDNIKLYRTGIKILGNGKGAHHKARLDLLNQTTGFAHEHTNRHVTALSVELTGENTHLGVAGCTGVELRYFFIENFYDAFAVFRDCITITGGKCRNFLFVRNLGEACKKRTLIHGFAKQGVGIAGKEGRNKFTRPKFICEEQLQKRGRNRFSKGIGIGEEFTPQNNTVNIR